MDTAPHQWASQDAGLVPWLGVLGYLVGAGLCARQFLCPPLVREKMFSLLAGFFMPAPGIN